MSLDSGGSTASTTSNQSADNRMVLDGGSIGVTSAEGTTLNILDAGAIQGALDVAARSIAGSVLNSSATTDIAGYALDVAGSIVSGSGAGTKQAFDLASLVASNAGAGTEQAFAVAESVATGSRADASGALDLAALVASAAGGSTASAIKGALDLATLVATGAGTVLDRGVQSQERQADDLASAYTDAKGNKDVLVVGGLLIGAVAIAYILKR